MGNFNKEKETFESQSKYPEAVYGRFWKTEL